MRASNCTYEGRAYDGYTSEQFEYDENRVRATIWVISGTDVHLTHQRMAFVWAIVYALALLVCLVLLSL